jgi:hypothetical protein
MIMHLPPAPRPVLLWQGSNSVQWHSFSNCSSNLTLAVPHNGWVLANVGELSQPLHDQPLCEQLRPVYITLDSPWLLCMPGLFAGQYVDEAAAPAWLLS